jgi:hypothetical protein
VRLHRDADQRVIITAAADFHATPQLMPRALPYQKLRDAVIAHLTVAEGIGPLLSNVPPRSAVA